MIINYLAQKNKVLSRTENNKIFSSIRAKLVFKFLHSKKLNLAHFNKTTYL